ncbi:hypothetical protein AVEN_247075-1 [Araneus ventricosus]|uniref:Uncharacterized protein n=1 Tax=Araneus ventricosus TaxID=182803 RepID=A0A4Y2HSE1_ARAVE|nr:hypothetical protein AVEN_247075-1 [Araneus ventricosus]
MLVERLSPRWSSTGLTLFLGSPGQCGYFHALVGPVVLVVRCRPWSLWVTGSKSDATEDTSCIEPVATQIMHRVKRPLLVWVRKFGEGVPTQVSSLSSDTSSKLRVKSQNYLLLLQKGTLM